MHLPDFYCVVLKKEDTPHYYKTLFLAMDYLCTGISGDFSLSIKNNLLIVDGVGWIQECYFEK